MATLQGDQFASIIRGRRVKPVVDTEVLNRLRQYIADLDQEQEVPAAEPVPQLLLDLQASKHSPQETVKLVALGDKSQEKYAALTYASDFGIARCLESDSPVNGDDVSIARLPQTFQDAILVTRALGVRYLWIDSLCIPCSITEWQRSSPQAGSVYANAYLTISATGAGNALGGLLFPRPERVYIQIPYKADGGLAGNVSVSSLSLDREVLRNEYLNMEDEPISSAVWSFQERVLSPRIVHFASDQVYIEGLQQLVSEDGLCEKKNYHTTAATLPARASDASSEVDTSSLKLRWEHMLWDYAIRVPAIPTDKLTALSNVARAYQRLLNCGTDDYIAGHWKSSLVESLCWQSLHCKPAGDSNAPSWAWVSVDGIPAMGFHARSHEDLARVSSTDVTLLDTTNPFGQVTAASITLEAPALIPLRLMEENEFKPGANLFGRVRLRAESGNEEGIMAGLDTIDRDFAVSADTLRQTRLFGLVLAATHRNGNCQGTCQSSSRTLHGLIVTPTASGSDRIRRLGFFLAELEDLGPSSLLENKETVTLV